MQNGDAYISSQLHGFQVALRELQGPPSVLHIEDEDEKTRCFIYDQMWECFGYFQALLATCCYLVTMNS